ncbi:MmgE/PrpD family protein [Cloacibacillus sp.]|uniref:MmgE/PrpD family protein n=1 Tax=Cloacibacillus sp. TaxID=2049023 RepID=UPI0025BBE9E4|nr:MmgE/PrpD family protein [Cloacibacillus sp.]MCC8058186.1 MmgE/PrpD family protein [Cloacibacillus sp.]
MEVIAKTLSQFASGAKYEDLPGDIVQCAKERIIDILSAAMAGSSLWEYRNKIIDTSRNMRDSGYSTIIGRKETASFPAAAAINCAYAHSVELDDGYRNAGTHAGAVVIPTALSLAEKFNIGGRRVILAVVIGYDVAYRFARIMSPLLIENGFHPSAVCGTMGAAAASASILQLNACQAANALSLSALFASGLMEVTRSGQSSKGAMVGHAAFAGIYSAMMAKNGFSAPEAPFSGVSGLFNAMSDNNVDAAKMLEGLGENYEIKDTYVKLYPTCRHTHAPIEGTVALCSEHNIMAEEVKRIDIGTHPVAFNLTGAAGTPCDAQQARFSTPYCVASALINGTFGIVDLKEENINDDRRAQLSSLIHVYVDKEVAAEFPQRRSAKIRIELKNGTSFVKTIYSLKGAPELPIGYMDLCDKFKNMAKTSVPNENIRKICDSVQKLDSMEELSAFMRLLKSTN